MDARKRASVARALRERGCASPQILRLVRMFGRRNLSDAKIDDIVARVHVTPVPSTMVAAPANPNDSPTPPVPGLSVDDIVDRVNDSEIASIQNVTAGIINIINGCIDRNFVIGLQLNKTEMQ